MEEKKGIFGGALGRMILPGIILQSVLIGGGLYEMYRHRILYSVLVSSPAVHL